MEEKILHSSEIQEQLANYLIDDSGRHLPERKQREYYTNIILFQAITRLIEEKKKALNPTKDKKLRLNWEEIASSIAELPKDDYPHSLPANHRALQRVYRLFIIGGIDSVISKRYNNKSAAKITDELQENLLITLMSDPRKFDAVQVATFYNRIAVNEGWTTISPQVVHRKMKQHDALIFARRNGENRWENERSMTIKRRNPKAAMSMWILDGWDAELYYQSTNKRGEVSYFNRPTVEMVIDPATNYIIGYAIGEAETADLIKAALKNAVRHAEQLFGAMYRPNQIQCDHYGLKANRHIYESLAIHFTPARVGNAKAKAIEPFFHRFNREYCQLQPNWSGVGITSRRESQPNLKLLQQGKKLYPTKEECFSQLALLIERDRQAKREATLQAFQNLPEERKHILPTADFLRLFGEERPRRVLMSPAGFLIMTNGITRHYDCFDHNFRKHPEIQWRVRVDKDDTSHILVENDDSTLRFVLEEKHEQPMTLIERSEGDRKALDRVADFNDQHKDDIALRLSTAMEQSSELIQKANERYFKDLQKFVMIDGHGDHKDRKNSLRLSNNTNDDVAELLDDALYDLY